MEVTAMLRIIGATDRGLERRINGAGLEPVIFLLKVPEC